MTSERSAPDMSVIIPAYRAETTIAEAIESVLAQEFDGTCDLIVVDSSPGDATAQVVQRFPGVVLVRSGKRLLAGEARNRGVAASAASFLAFIDADAVAQPGWLQAMHDHLAGGTHVVGGSVAPSEHNTSLASRAEYIFEFNEFTPARAARKSWFVPSCNMACTREAFEKSGGFPRSLFSEDIMFSIRLRRAGFIVEFDPSVSVKHRNRSRLGPVFRTMYLLGKYNARVRIEGYLESFGVLKKRAISWLFIPLVGLAKFARLGLRTVTQGMPYLVEFVLVSPIMIVGHICWTVGFYAGVYLPVKDPEDHES